MTDRNDEGAAAVEPEGVRESPLPEICERFDAMNLREEVLRGINDYGFEVPTDIQRRAIIPCVRGRDVVAQDWMGTGKTSMISIVILQQIDMSIRDCQALVLAPTRAIAKEIHLFVLKLGKFTNVSSHAFIGKPNVLKEAHILKAGCQVIIGTPIRINRLIRQKSLLTNNIKLLVLEEADDMSRSFMDQIRDIYEMLPDNVQVVLLSATMPQDGLKLSCFSRNPVNIAQELTLEGIKQFYIDVRQENFKVRALCDLCDKLPLPQSVIFCNTRQKVLLLAREMKKKNFTVSVMIGGMKQRVRKWNLERFRSGSSRFLITTDSLDRQIYNANQAKVTINYDFPTNIETYFRRIYRRPSFGIPVAFSFITKREDIEIFYQTVIEEMPSHIVDII